MKKYKRYINALIISVILLVFLYPILFTLLSSFKDDTAIFSKPFALPRELRFVNYQVAFSQGRLLLSLYNSLVLSISVMLITGLVSSMASYIFSRFNFKYKKFLFVFFLLGLAVPIQVTVIPLAFSFSYLGLNNNMFVIILLSAAFSLSFSILLMSAFFNTIPKEIDESAKIDGCKDFTIYWKLLLPVSISGTLTVSVFNFLNTWNGLLFPLVFLRKASQQVIPIALISFKGQYSSSFGPNLAAIIISILIPVIIYLLFHSKIDKGLLAGSVKG